MRSSKFSRSRSLVVLIPALNEVLTIGRIVRDVKAAVNGDVVVIDDASTDGTAEAARAAGAVVLPHTLRSGAWGAMRTGFRYAAAHGYEIAVTMDADGQHPADSVLSVVAPVESNQADVVIGSCLHRGSPARKFAWAFFRKLAMLEIKDLTSGFRAYNRDAICALISADTGLLDYQDIGVLLCLQKRGLKISETPVKMCPRISGHSRVFSSWFAVFQYLVFTGILCLSKLK